MCIHVCNTTRTHTAIYVIDIYTREYHCGFFFLICVFSLIKGFLLNEIGNIIRHKIVEYKRKLLYYKFFVHIKLLLSLTKHYSRQQGQILSTRAIDLTKNSFWVFYSDYHYYDTRVENKFTECACVFLAVH